MCVCCSQSESEACPHPAGVILRRPGYYTMPSLDELADMTDEDGSCVVDKFVVGREGFGNVLFSGQTDVAGLNLDEIGASSWYLRLDWPNYYKSVYIKDVGIQQARLRISANPTAMLFGI